jgi:hypothetical protein
MADEVPLDVFRQDFVFVAHFKGMVLAKDALVGVVGFLQVADGLGLADRNKGYRIGQCRPDFLYIIFYHGLNISFIKNQEPQLVVVEALSV